CSTSCEKVNVPISRGPRIAAPPPKNFGQMASDSFNPSVQKTVLVVEHNDLNSKLLNDLLQYQGYTVVTTRFGEPALELARRHKPDAILMDSATRHRVW